MFCSLLLFSNFGLVEYSVMHPKTKYIQSDSLQRTQKTANLYQSTEVTSESKQEEENNSESNTASWGQYLVLGMKAIVGFFVNILARF